MSNLTHAELARELNAVSELKETPVRVGWVCKQAAAALASLADARLSWQCKARTGNVGVHDPQDCDWPGCGCDPYAEKVIKAIEESGFTIVRTSSLADARRILADLVRLKNQSVVLAEASAIERTDDWLIDCDENKHAFEEAWAIARAAAQPATGEGE